MFLDRIKPLDQQLSHREYQVFRLLAAGQSVDGELNAGGFGGLGALAIQPFLAGRHRQSPRCA